VIAAPALPHKVNRMKPPLPRIQSDVPRTLHAQFEVVKSIRTVVAPDEDGAQHRRRAEIAAIRHDLEALARDIPRAFEEASALVKAELRGVLAKKYNSDQPRVPAGNRDGGRWTDGSEIGGETSSDRSDDRASDGHNLPTRYAQASTNTATDATSGGGNVAVTTVEETQHDLSNLYHALVAAGYTALGEIAHYLFNSHYFDINVIGADQVPNGHPRQPVPFVDSDGDPIVVDGKPRLRPIGLPPELYAQAGMAVRSWVKDLIEICPTLRKIRKH
jgi:hypothetical protein